jgi:hypothetical protein
VYLGALYRGVGASVAAGLVALGLFLVLWMLPLALWGLVSTGGVRRNSGGAALMLALLLGGGALWGRAASADAMPLPQAMPDALARALAAVDVSKLPRSKQSGSLHTGAAASCARSPRDAAVTLLAVYLSPRPTAQGKSRVTARARCFQADDITGAVQALDAELTKAAVRHPIKLDLITGHASVPTDADLIQGLTLRPGLDGVCLAGACLAPWQLVARDAFVRHVPLPSVPDARLGVSLERLRRSLDLKGQHADQPLLRITSHSVVLTSEGVQPHRRSRRQATVDATSVAHASALAYGYILAAQGKDGQFDYLVHPFSGKLLDRGFSAARQAGTTLALCELAPHDKRSRLAATLAAAKLASLARPVDEARAVLRSPRTEKAASEKIGASALGMAALLRCRERLGPVHDQLIGRLARLLLAQQRPDGSFAHFVHVASGKPTDQKGSFYVDGQVVLALSLAEAARSPDTPAFPPRNTLHQAVERGMSWVADSYWNHFAGSLFFLEENWHCIAAAASLEHHRHDGYERFCLDYLRFKGRLIHQPGEAHADFAGGYGIGNFVPPHNTATAGFGEALAAGLQIKRARGMPLRRDAERMRAVMAFLLKNQWRDDNCFACARTRRIVGGFSEHMASPRLRIDYVQHAWAALGQGAEALEL